MSDTNIQATEFAVPTPSDATPEEIPVATSDADSRLPISDASSVATAVEPVIEEPAGAVVAQAVLPLLEPPKEIGEELQASAPAAEQMPVNQAVAESAAEPAVQEPEEPKPGVREPGEPEPAVREPGDPEPDVREPGIPNEPDEPVTPEPPLESFGDIFSEFQRTHSRRDEQDGRQIRGTVVKVDAESVYVDIGYKSEGILPLAAFAHAKEPVKVGDTPQVSVKGRDTDGYYELSLFRTAQPRDWSSLEKAFADKSTIVGTVTGVVKGGLHVDVGIRAFLPGSRSGTRDAAEMEKLVGQEIRCRITKLDVQDEDVVVDRRVVTEEEALRSKAERYAAVEVGAVVDGTVRSLTEYGAFIDLGGIDGLLHISDIAWNRIAKASDVLTLGQQLEVKVLKIDPENQRISLGLKQLQAHPWDAVPQKYALGDKVRGVVTRTTDFGAFVEIEPGIEGLVHLSEMSWSRRILKATEVMKEGDAIEAVILGLNLTERRISLSLKQTLGDPWTELASRISAGSIVEGPVASITKFGAFVTVSDGVEGMVHISEITKDRRLNHPSDVLHVGEAVRALVLEIDREKRQLRLSIKQLIPTGFDEFLKEHTAGDRVTGRVVSLEHGVAQIELGDGILCPCILPVAAPVVLEPQIEAATPAKVDLSAFSSMLKTKWKTGAVARGSKPEAAKPEAVKVGQVRNFRVAQLDAETKLVRIELIP